MYLPAGFSVCSITWVDCNRIFVVDVLNSKTACEEGFVLSFVSLQANNTTYNLQNRRIDCSALVPLIEQLSSKSALTKHIPTRRGRKG